MKKIFVLLILVFSGCERFPNLDKVKTKKIEIPLKEEDKAINELYALYEMSDKTKQNYEVYNYGRRFAINWNPKGKALFFATDLCGWDHAFKNVGEAEIKKVISANIDVDGVDGLSKEFQKLLELVKDDKELTTIRSQHFTTNICRGGKRNW